MPSDWPGTTSQGSNAAAHAGGVSITQSRVAIQPMCRIRRFGWYFFTASVSSRGKDGFWADNIVIDTQGEGRGVL
jgi:hypothetical protein